jgi:hypothetical protein
VESIQVLKKRNCMQWSSNYHCDALLNPGVNPLRGSPMSSCEKLGPRARSRLPTLKKGRGSCWEPRDWTRKRLSLCEFASKDQPQEVSLAFGTPLGVGTSHGHLDTQDSPRPRLGGSQHLPSHSIICSSQWRLHSNGTNSWDSRNGVPKLSRQDSWNFERP